MAIRSFDRDQGSLLPHYLIELMRPDHPARFVAAFVDALPPEDLAELDVAAEAAQVGAPAYHPVALLSIWLYGFMVGIRSCRKLEVACYDQVPLLWLSGRLHPDHNTLWRFYKKHRQWMRKLLKRTVRMAVIVGLVDLAFQAVDGTKVQGNASKYRTLDAKALQGLLERTERVIKELEAQNEGGEDPPPPSLPDELAEAQALHARIEAALQYLKDEEQERTNMTDPDAQLMKGRHGVVAGYNAQAVVAPLLIEDGPSGVLITAADVVTEANDTQQLAPMTAQAEETTGVRAAVTLADAGYHSGAALAACADEDHRVVMPEPQDAALAYPYHKDRFLYDPATDSFTCPEGQQLVFRGQKITRGTPMRLYRGSPKVCRACPAFGLCTRDRRHGRALEIGPYDHQLREHRAWMATEEAQRWKRRRGALVEPVFGIVKEQMGLRRFLLRGLENVRAEWALLATAFNLRVLWKAWAVHQRPSHPAAPLALAA